VERDLTCAYQRTFHARTSGFAITGAPESRMIVYVPVANEDVELLSRMRRRSRRHVTATRTRVHE